MKQRQTIEEYVRALAGLLPLPPDRVLRVATEVEGHLREAMESLVAEGVGPEEAERLAIERFGAPEVVARGFVAGPVAWLRLGREMASSLMGMAVVGLLAIGLSGLLALALALAFGKSFVAGDVSGVTYTAARCSELMKLVPSASTCNQAAADHHFTEIVFSRLGAGILGLLAAGGYLLLRARLGRPGLPPAFNPTVGASLFSAAALAQIGMIGGSNGQHGALLAGALVSALVAAWYGLRLTRALGPWVRAGS